MLETEEFELMFVQRQSRAPTASQIQNPPPPSSSTKSGRFFGRGNIGQYILCHYALVFGGSHLDVPSHRTTHRCSMRRGRSSCRISSQITAMETVILVQFYIRMKTNVN